MMLHVHGAKELPVRCPSLRGLGAFMITVRASGRGVVCLSYSVPRIFPGMLPRGLAMRGTQVIGGLDSRRG